MVQFTNLTENADHLSEFDGYFMLTTFDHSKVYDRGKQVVTFIDGAGRGCVKKVEFMKYDEWNIAFKSRVSLEVKI